MFLDVHQLAQDFPDVLDLVLQSLFQGVRELRIIVSPVVICLPIDICLRACLRHDSLALGIELDKKPFLDGRTLLLLTFRFVVYSPVLSP